VARLCRRAGVTFIVNDRVDVALASDADGVHLGQEDFPVALARRILGPDRIIGASVDHPDECEAAWRDGADYVGFGPIYGTASKSDTGPVVSVAGLREWLPKFRLPVIAIGGIDAGNIAPVLGAGAHGVAVLSSICRADDPEIATRELSGLVRSHAA
jgi:thiamine-phosphate pyrophosphorylase